MTLRIGSVPYLNALPLLHGLRDQSDVRLSFNVPRILAAELRCGQLDAALVPSLEYFRGGYDFAPNVSIASVGPVDSVLLFLRKEPKDIRRLGLDVNSMTSVALAQILLREKFGLANVETIDVKDSESADKAGVDAFVLIGDPALSLRRTRKEYLDLGAEWFSWTQLPFVYALWLFPKEKELNETALPRQLLESKISGLRELKSISLEAVGAKHWGSMFSAEEIQLYLEKSIDYDLTERHLAGLQRFGNLARKYGFPS